MARTKASVFSHVAAASTPSPPATIKVVIALEGFRSRASISTPDVLRTGPTDEAMTVQWTLGNPTLAQGQWGASANDFIDPATGQPYTTNTSTPITGSLSFAAGQGTARFTLEAGHDATPEGDERFAVEVAVTGLDGHALTAQAHQIDSVVGVILNDDALPPQFDPAVDQQVHLPLDVLH
jgi:hypothetical protein